jgi:hypothetical protein
MKSPLKIGQGKRRFGLDLILEKLAVTQGSTIALKVLVLNLEKLLEVLFVFFIVLDPASAQQSARKGFAFCAPE